MMLTIILGMALVITIIVILVLVFTQQAGVASEYEDVPAPLLTGIQGSNDPMYTSTFRQSVVQSGMVAKLDSFNPLYSGTIWFNNANPEGFQLTVTTSTKGDPTVNTTIIYLTGDGSVVSVSEGTKVLVSAING